MKKLLLFLILFGSASVWYIGNSQASDQTITCSPSGCTGITGSLFNETNLAPLESVTRLVKATNNYGESRRFGVSIDSLSFADSDPKLSQTITITIYPHGGATAVYGPVTIEQWKNAGLIPLTVIPAGSDQTYDFVAEVANLGNEFQSKALFFDLQIGFEANAASTVTATDTSLSSSSNQTCTATAPTQAPFLTGLGGGQNTAVLSWTSTTPSTHYMIQYGTNGNWLYGNPNVGSGTSYAVGSLSGNTTYAFRIAAVNDCALGPWSNQISLSTIGPVIGVVTPAPGFEPVVLGIQEEATPSASVLGAVDACKTSIEWWIPLATQLGLELLLLLVIWKFSHRYRFITALFIFGLSQLAHWWVGCPCDTSEWCNRYVWINALLVILLLFSPHKRDNS